MANTLIRGMAKTFIEDMMESYDVDAEEVAVAFREALAEVKGDAEDNERRKEEDDYDSSIHIGGFGGGLSGGGHSGGGFGGGNFSGSGAKF